MGGEQGVREMLQGAIYVCDPVSTDDLFLLPVHTHTGCRNVSGTGKGHDQSANRFFPAKNWP